MTGHQLHPLVLTRNNVCNYRFEPRNGVTAGFTISSRFFFFPSLSLSLSFLSRDGKGSSSSSCRLIEG